MLRHVHSVSISAFLCSICERHSPDSSNVSPFRHLPSPQKQTKKGGKPESGERRRKSLLPWYRKDRSKSKDRGEADYKRKKRQREREETGSVRSDLSGSRSSLASADLANLQRNAASREVRVAGEVTQGME